MPLVPATRRSARGVCPWQERLGDAEADGGDSSDSPLRASDDWSDSDGEDMPELDVEDLDEESEGERERTPPAMAAGDDEQARESMLHVFAGLPRLGSPEDAAAGVHGHVDSVDLLQGGWQHDVRNPDVRARLLAAVRAKRYPAVWIGMPCSSFTLWRLVSTLVTIRSRQQPEGVDGLPDAEQAYVELHNALAEFTAELAEAAFLAGCTVVIENPADRGKPGSPLFKWSARGHAPLWLLACMQRLVTRIRARMITFPQCVFGPFQKWTTLLVAGPRAFEFEVLADLRCVHTSHAKVARGRDERGRSNAAASAAYPLGMVALLVWILLRPEEWRLPGVWPRPQDFDHAALQRVADSIQRQQQSNELAAASFLGGCQACSTEPAAADGEMAALPTPRQAKAAWRSAPASMPADWAEREDVTGERWQRRSSEQLRFISRRRFEPEDGEVLARRAMPVPHVPPETGVMHGPYLGGWPEGAPPRPIRIDQLYFPGVYTQIRAAIVEGSTGWPEVASSSSGVPSGGSQRAVPKIEARVWPAALSQPAWARSRMWDATDPGDCVPIAPYTEEDPVRHEVSRSFFREWGDRLRWTDRDMLRQLSVTGAESRSACEWDTVVMGHHRGLRLNFEPAAESVASDTAAGWITSGRLDLWTVPGRLVPKNTIVQPKWKIEGEGALQRLVRKVKHRVSTDDSIEATDLGATGGAPQSRNNGMDREDWDEATLPSIQTLGEAVAVVRSIASGMGFVAAQAVLERIALWALDLSNAYREIEVNRTDWWLQQFIWSDGVRLDRRCVFGAAHMPGLFQRVSTFVLAVAMHRVRQYDQQHPYSAARQAWTAWRALHAESADAHDTAFASIYLDDGSGLTVLGAGEPVHGAPDVRGRPVASSVTVDPSGSVRLGVFGDKSRGQTHLAIVEATFVDAGWKVAIGKKQYGLSLDLLGQGITSQGDGALYVPEAKRLGLIEDIEAQQGPAEQASDSPLSVAREEVERLVGRLSNVGQIACEANPYLAPMYRVQNARISVQAKAGRRHREKRGRDQALGAQRVLPGMVKVKGRGPSHRAYQGSLAWWRAALASHVTVPLAPRLAFPDVAAEGCAFLFTDAARENGTGHGAFSVVQFDGEAHPQFLYVEQRWSADTLRALQSDELSMPAGEAYGAVIAADAMLAALPGATHMVIFTDSEATEAAINSGNSGSPQMNGMIQWLFERWPGVQFLGVWQKGVRNDVADGISRQGLAEVLAQAQAAGLVARRLPIPGGADRLLAETVSREQGAAHLPARDEGSCVTVCHRAHEHECASPVRILRPGPAGNPFAVLVEGTLDEDWRDACCDAFESAFDLAMAGGEGSLAAIADKHDLPPDSVRMPYASQDWHTYARALRAKASLLRSRAVAGERLSLVCACHPRRCHGTTVARWIQQQSAPHAL